MLIKNTVVGKNRRKTFKRKKENNDVESRKSYSKVKRSTDDREERPNSCVERPDLGQITFNNTAKRK